MPDTPGTLNFPTSLDTAVSLFEVSNRAYTTMTGSIGTGDLSIGVANGSLLPSTGAVTLVDSLSAPTKVEHVIYTVNSSNTLTVPAGGRGFGGSTAQTWSGTVYVRARALAQHHSVLRGGIIALETKLGINSSTPSSGTILRGTGAGASDWGALVNADVSASAAIALSKLAALTASRAVITDVSGVVSAATTTATEIGYVNGVTSAIQTQLDAKQATFGSQTANYVYAGPTSGGAASPSFRALVSGDLPSHNQAWSTITSTPTTLSGYGITDAAASGAVTSSGLTMATARLLGRSTASTGAIEEISIGSGLTLSAGTLSASGGGLTVGTTTIASGTAGRLLYETSGNVLGEVSTLTSDGSVLTMTRAGIGTTSTDSIVLTNSTAAAAGAQQYSPRLRLTGQGWKTNATAASQTVDWVVENVPVQGSANPTTYLGLSSQVNGGGYTSRFRFNSDSSFYWNNGSGFEGFISPDSSDVYASQIGNAAATALRFRGNNGVAALTFLVGSSGQFGFKSTTFTSGAPADSVDTGLARAAAGVIRATNGSTGAATFSSAANTPSQITVDQNNYTPGVGLFQRWSSDASRNVTGLAAGQAGQIAYIWNVGSFDIVLVNESASSTAANRFTNSGGADITLAANRCVFAQYDATSSRWRAALL